MTFSDILKLLQKIFSNNLVKSVLVVLVSFVVYKVISYILHLRGKRLKYLERKKSETYLRLVNSIFKYTVLIFAFFALLSVNNVNITSMVAGLGIAGIILGITVQDALKDIIRGFNIISDNYFNVGDIIEYDDFPAQVLELGLKTTKIRDLKNENVISVPNRSIEAAVVMSNQIYIDIPMPYETPLNAAENTLAQICCEAEKDLLVSECTYIGVNLLDESAIKYLLKVTASDNSKRLQTRRNTLRTVIDVMAQNGISVPYNQLDIHNK